MTLVKWLLDWSDKLNEADDSTFPGFLAGLLSIVLFMGIFLAPFWITFLVGYLVVEGYLPKIYILAYIPVVPYLCFSIWIKPFKEEKQ